MLSTRQVAQKLQVSPNTVKKLWREGRLRGYRISERKIRFRPEDVADFLSSDTADPSHKVRQSTHRLAENRWCQEHRQELLELAGQWIVLEPDGVVAHDVDPLVAFSVAKEKGVSVPYIFFLDHPAPPGVVRTGL